jgi:hypothetical protein
MSALGTSLLGIVNAGNVLEKQGKYFYTLDRAGQKAFLKNLIRGLDLFHLRDHLTHAALILVFFRL